MTVFLCSSGGATGTGGCFFWGEGEYIHISNMLIYIISHALWSRPLL